MLPHKTIVLDSHRLAASKDALSYDVNEEVQQAFAALIAQADRWIQRHLEEGSWTVTRKTVCAPSGDIHDYVSQAPYYWPSSDPLIYEHRDGERNPETIKLDKADCKKVFHSTHTLSLA